MTSSIYTTGGTVQAGDGIYMAVTFLLALIPLAAYAWTQKNLAEQRFAEASTARAAAESARATSIERLKQ